MLENVVNGFFMVSFVLTVIFFFMKKKMPCFISSLVCSGSLLILGILEVKWFEIIFWSAAVIIDVVEYKMNDWDLFGHFDD